MNEHRRAVRAAAHLLLGILLLHGSLAAAPREPAGEPRVPALSLSRPVRPWEFLDAVGMRAGLFGREAGPFEAWIYPLKILREMTLQFKTADRVMPAGPLARTVTVRPESADILYASDGFAVRQTLFVPVDEPGIVVLIEAESAGPLEVLVSFRRDVQLMWPAAPGATSMTWDDGLRAFVFGEEERRFFALFGSPSGRDPSPEYFTNQLSKEESSFSLGRIGHGDGPKVVVIAASFRSEIEAAETYRRLAAGHADLRRRGAAHFAAYLGRTVRVDLPDRDLQAAYDWSRISLAQGMVANPFLGTGLVAGYGTSGIGARPGFAWFFGRDALWSSLALTAIGDFAGARTALEFLIKHQRDDGKMPHEIAQSAPFVRWFEDYPYGYASADATPLFLLAARDYAARSGDVAFVKENRASLVKAHEFLRSMRDERGLARNRDVGHGWVEGGPLLPVRTELYQSGLGVAALRAMADLARMMGDEEKGEALDAEFARGKDLLNEAFWIPGKKIYAFALDEKGRRVERASVLATVPMWFDLLDAEKAGAMIDRLAGADHAADWGMRIISSRSDLYDPAGYHFGSVWPLFTGWAAVGEYRYHRELPAFANLRANAALVPDGALGRATEVLSGDYYEPLSTSSPHQIWSSAMVISPLLRGLFGLDHDALAGRLTFSPHVPAAWDSFALDGLPLGDAVLSLAYRRTSDAITLEMRRDGPGEALLEFAPAVSPRAEILGVEVDGRPVPHRLEATAVDQHVVARVPVGRERSVLTIRLRDDFGLEVPAGLPPLGEPGRNLRIVSETWTGDRGRLALEVEGLSGRRYEIAVRGADRITAVEGAELEATGGGAGRLLVRTPGAADRTWTRRTITIRLRSRE